MLKYFLGALLLLNQGCQQRPLATSSCSLSLLDTNAIGENQYEHFVVLHGYENTCCAQVALADLARAYADTARRRTPILYVTFLRPASQDFYDHSEPDIAGLLTYQIVRYRLINQRVEPIASSFQKKGKRLL